MAMVLCTGAGCSWHRDLQLIGLMPMAWDVNQDIDNHARHLYSYPSQQSHMLAETFNGLLKLHTCWLL